MNRDQKALLDWYSQNKRVLPWRGKADPYAVWISEVMLQQTTVTAVIPYYEKFLERFPNVRELADAKESEILKYWAGLGYYSRARMLHKAAKEISKNGFPMYFDELIKLPGFGPYTARAVASLAFGESVGAVDGNVIRVLTRKNALKVDWWKPQGREQIQKLADILVRDVSSSDVNQALMDLGSSHCSTKSPTCFLCPWMKTCAAHAEGKPENYPGSKPKRGREVWIWQPEVHRKGQKVLLVENNYAPFLRGQWMPPGKASQSKKAPKKFLFRHSITHHDIFVVPAKESSAPKGRFIDSRKVAEVNPASLLRKLLELA